MPLVSGGPMNDGSRLRLGNDRKDLRSNHGRMGIPDDQMPPLDPDHSLQLIQGERPRWDPGMDVSAQIEEGAPWE